MSALSVGAVYFFETHWYTVIILYGTKTQVIYIYISMKMSNIVTCFFFRRFNTWTGFRHRISRSFTWSEL
jgi:hypothetical protein